MDENERRASGHSPAETTGGEAGGEGPLRRSGEGLPSGEVRIAAVQAAVAAGLASSTRSRPERRPSEAPRPGPDRGVADRAPEETGPRSADAARDEEFAPFAPEAILGSEAVAAAAGAEAPGDEDVLAAFGIPDWTDPPTGQVPRILLDDPDAPVEPEAAVGGPIWREDASDWDDVPDHLAYLAEETEATVVIAGREPDSPTGEHDLLGLSDLDAALSGTLGRAEDESAWQDVLAGEPDDEVEATDPFARRARSRRHRRARRRGAPGDDPVRAEAPPRRSAVRATATGVVFGIVALCCILGGAASSLGLAVAVLVLATGEVCGALRRAGYVPATLVALLAVPALAIGAYAHGTSTVVLVLALALVASALWSLAGTRRRDRVESLAVSLFVVVWVGLLGAFAGLLLSPSAFAHRHGVDLFFGALLVTVAHDVGSYAVGSRLGRHRLAPRLSPGKSVEGLIGGTVLAFGVALGLVWQISPYDLGDVLGLAAVVSVFAPLGDLFESLVKRDLDLKDMGSLLPGHGGIFDRIDAMLFVLPAAYYFARLVHFG